MRLIDADALLKALRVNEDEWGTPNETWRPEKEYGGAIKMAPTIEAVPVRHGGWEEREVHGNVGIVIVEWQSARCSVCGRYHTTPYMYYFDEYHYCPSCGAKMDGGTDNETD